MLKELGWCELPNRKASRIKTIRKGDVNIKSNWDEYFNWLSKKVLLFQDTFSKY